MEAAHWRPLAGGRVQCDLCPIRCRIKRGRRGACLTRANEGGRLIAAGYGAVTVQGVEPIEKKPLYHFHPGRRVVSFGSWGCNMACAFCQNWTISQREVASEHVEPAEAVRRAVAARAADPDVVGVSFSFNEPLVWFEYVRDVLRLARSAGLPGVLKTNGYVEPEPLDEVIPYIAAVNVDVKAWNAPYYRRVCRAELGPVKRTVERLVAAGVWVEVTTVVVAGQNDADAEIEGMAAWLGGLGRHIPLHLARYVPDFRMTDPATPVEALERARAIARRHLDHVYLGNLWTGPSDVIAEAGRTRCAGCGAVLVERDVVELVESRLAGGACPECGRAMAGVGLAPRVS